MIFDTWIERNPEIHTATEDFNDYWTRAHLKAFIRGGGSTSENIVMAFVKNDPNMIPPNYDLAEAWARLDARQQNLVKALRMEMLGSHGYPMSEATTLQHFFNCMCKREFELLCYEWNEENRYSDMPFETELELANEATRTVAERVVRSGDTSFDPPYRIVHDEEEEEEY
ncbi:hypothetical protein ACPV5S_15595 [Vibrio astriarenae]